MENRGSWMPCDQLQHVACTECVLLQALSSLQQTTPRVCIFKHYFLVDCYSTTVIPQVWYFFSHACCMALRMPMSACQSIAVVQTETTAGDGWNHWCDTILARHSWFPVSWQLRFWVKSSKMIGWIFMKFGTHVHVPIRMKSNHFYSSSGAIIQFRFVLYFVTCRNDIHISCTMSSSKMLAC